MLWEDYKNEFEPDGSLRDIYIKGVGLDDWQAFMDFLRKTDAVLDFHVDGDAVGLPVDISEVILDQHHTYLLSIGLQGVSVHCHFFLSEEIELNVDPREIDSEVKAKIVFRLMTTAGRTLKKRVIMTPENMQDQVVFEYEPGMGVRHRPLDT